MPNPQIELARDFIRETDHSIFLTGKAGTGKTTFLHALAERPPKRMIVTAPTGVAAINAGGVTLHSFFQLPFGPFVPGGEVERQAAAHRLNRQKRDIIQSLDLLVIDEISMVRCDLLDAVDFVLRHQRRSSLPFGGVQLLMIGDLHQLAPVVPEQDWAILRDHYESGYFFSSRALGATRMVQIALERIYRQADTDFIELLNLVRDNRLDERSLARLNSRHLPGFQPDDADGYITLTTHTRSADHINEVRLRALGAKPQTFTARIEGDYAAHSYPTAEKLVLKQGAQVMFVRNDGSAEKRFFNGKIGTVTRLERDRVLVQCPGEPGEIEVEPVTWENIKYSIDPQTKEIGQEVIGAFTQYPLRLAWAITIHKSQGLTFERAIIDAAAAFSHGQVYVALSRCKTFEGMVLSTPIPRHAVMTDRVVAQYVGAASLHPPTREQLDDARIAYQQRLLQECWDFDALGKRLRRLLGALRDNERIIDLHGADGIDALEQQVRKQVVQVGELFRRELADLYRADKAPEEDAHLQERVRKASAYFSAKLQETLVPWLAALSFDTDNQALAKTLRQARDDLRRALATKTACIESCRERFSTPVYLDALAKAGIDSAPGGPRAPKQPGDRLPAAADDSLLAELRRWRARKREEEARAGDTRHRILTRAVLRQIAETLPNSPETLAAVQGIGKRTVERYGKEILAIVSDYCRRNDIDPEAIGRPAREPKPTPDAGDGDTRLISYRLYREGLSVEEIASRRSLKPTTIEGHLARYIASGDLAVTDFLADNKLARITAVLAETGAEGLALAKQALGDECSYGELKMVQAHLARQR